ncbi:MAG: bifunctional diaminohydroxyphosphoribosylaminopyrimidine deaminase/5-amino-6-(5-phosphoribosylamino)uracil reductase RibD [Acidimicrobiales bacterium]|nr:bifunctional diaminohydroxyphosphoribosylaminopyrimidine deaminase/5-amino-6-(5-phosphoribosylamino)uracil reductase RibD [Acidimicrobiales bacterium]
MDLHSKKDLQMMDRAIENGNSVRLISPPNPWVGAVLLSQNGSIYDGATRPVGYEHAEIVCLAAAADSAKGGTLYTTLEPCSHSGNTPPCTDAIIAAGVSKVVVGVIDPDINVNGKGIATLRSAGIEVSTGIKNEEIEEQLAPYLHHRRTGRPYVVVKVAATLDGRIAAPDGTSQWITSPLARAEGHRLRAYSDAVCVGAGTVRVDNPRLTVRDWSPALGGEGLSNPLRVVLGDIPADALIHPCIKMEGEIGGILIELGKRDILQLLVEGGANTIHRFHEVRMVNRYEIFLATAFTGGNDSFPIFSGLGVTTVKDLWRGEIVNLSQIDNDIHVTIVPKIID